jgi:hypothetical protein
MKKSVLAFAAAAMLAAALPSAAQARCDGCGVAAGVIGGLAAGAIIGGAIAGQPAYAAPPPPPPPPPSRVYYEDDDAPVCHIEHRRVWVEGWGWRHRRVEVCE